MRNFWTTASSIIFTLVLANGLGCSKTGDSEPNGATPGTTSPTVNGSIPAAATLDTQALDRRIRETVLVTLDPYCNNELKKVADEKSADLKFKATIDCKNEPPYGRTKDARDISISEFFATIDSIQTDLASLKVRTDATPEQRQMVEAFEQAFKEKEGKVLLETKDHYDKDFRARTAMLATLNMKITRHPSYERQAYDTVEWIDGASRDVSLAAGVRQICKIHKEEPHWYGGALWITKENRYTTAHETARMVSELVFASVGAETSFRPNGIETNWVMTGVKEYLQAYFGYNGNDICYQDGGIEELEKMVTMIKSGEWARKWAALPKVSMTSTIYLHDSMSSAPYDDGVIHFSKLFVEFTQQRYEGHLFKVGFNIPIYRLTPSQALDLAASTATQGIKALDEVVALTQEFTQAIREAAPTRKEYSGWVAVSFASLSATPAGVYVHDIIQDTKIAREAISIKDKWLPMFVKYDTIEKANDYEFSSCRRTNVLPRLVYNSKQDFSTIKCKGGELIWFVRE